MIEEHTPQLKLHWSWIDSFLVVQYLLGAILLVPGMQSVRFAVRALPFVMSLLMWLLLHRKITRRDLPAGSTLLIFAMIWMGLELFHPFTQYRAGFAQFVFQLSIAAPAFWVGRLIDTPLRLQRAVFLIFLFNALSAGTGLLQVYYPDRFMPKEFNHIAEGRHEDRERTYVTTNGRKITRPPGLTDTPGGSAVAAMITAVLGLALGARPRQKLIVRMTFALMAAAGMLVLYLTQVRVLFLVSLMAVLALMFLGTRRRGVLSSTWIGGAAAVIVIGAFVQAVSVGGISVYKRFVGISDSGLLSSYDTSRGKFLQQTFGEMMFEYPLGAGLGRWGMMNTYFNDDNDRESVPIWAEIQVTGWLLDGGVVLWIFYGGAIALSLLSAYRIALARNQQPNLSFLAAVVFALNIATVGVSATGLPFNTQMGLAFWLLAAGLHGAARPRVRPARWVPVLSEQFRKAIVTSASKGVEAPI